MSLAPIHREILSRHLEKSGLRTTRQRELVFEVLLDQRDHPTADEVYARARTGMDNISLATVYNCLETLVQCGLVRQVNVEREPSRFCPNLAEHAHFYDRHSGRVYDVDLPAEYLDRVKEVLPQGYSADEVEITFRGNRTESSN